MEIVTKLEEVMHKTYERRTVLLCEKVSGEEEVPDHVQAIIITDATDYPDVLAHVSVRARNLKVMFAVLFDEAKVKELLALNDKHITLSIENQKVKYAEANPNLPQNRKGSSTLVL